MWIVVSISLWFGLVTWLGLPTVILCTSLQGKLYSTISKGTPLAIAFMVVLWIINENHYHLWRESMTYKTLWDLPTKLVAEISGLDQDMPKSMATRLQEMGFNDGQPIRCVKQCPFNGPKVVQLGDCVLSVDRHIAENIQLRT